MKKNVMMRLAAILLVCVLATTCGISGTFAKYATSAETSDTARVAKWGVKVFSTVDGTAFAKNYANSKGGTPNVVVLSEDFVVAPGTNSDEVNGNLIFGVTGTPEVATEITVNFTGSDIFYGNYHPITFTLWVMDNNAPIANPENVTKETTGWTEAATGTLEELVAAIETSFGSFNTEAGETLDALYMITWKWNFELDDHADTRLGDLAAAGRTNGVDENTQFSTVLNYGVTITVEQVD